MIAGPPVTWACRPVGQVGGRDRADLGDLRRPTFASSVVSTGTATTATVPSGGVDRRRGLAADRERRERRGAGGDRRLVVGRQRRAVVAAVDDDRGRDAVARAATSGAARPRPTGSSSGSPDDTSGATWRRRRAWRRSRPRAARTRPSTRKALRRRATWAVGKLTAVLLQAWARATAECSLVCLAIWTLTRRSLDCLVTWTLPPLRRDPPPRGTRGLAGVRRRRRALRRAAGDARHAGRRSPAASGSTPARSTRWSTSWASPSARWSSPAACT